MPPKPKGQLWANVTRRSCRTISFRGLPSLRPSRPWPARAAAVAISLGDRSCLLVIDDAWRPEHLRPFLKIGTRCARLFTTRNVAIAADEAEPVKVDRMTDAEAIDLLGRRLPGVTTNGALLTPLARRLGRWPLLLNLANGKLRSFLRHHGTLPGWESGPDPKQDYSPQSCHEGPAASH
jgi:hypothetical protein